MIELYTLDEAAALVKLSRRTLERDAAAGRLRVRRIGPGKRRVVVTSAELEAYVTGVRRSA